jgi:HPt (histidine-containing phosphotransfer) domain-containing protein
MGDHQIIDMDDVMDRLQDDKDLLFELLDIFTADFQDKRKQLAELLTNKDFDGIKDVVHSLKGAAGNISACALYASCVLVEEQAEHEDSAGIAESYLTIDKQFKDLLLFTQELKAG